MSSDFLNKKKVNNTSQAYLINTYVIIILAMLLCIGVGVSVCLTYLSKHDRLHQDLSYIVYLLYCIDFDCISVVFKKEINV